MASGKAFNDTRQALIDLGLDDAACRQLGIRLHKVAVVWPLEAQLTREFATGPAGDPGGRGEAPGHRIPAQGRALQLARRRAAQRGRQVRRGRGARGRRLFRRRMVDAQPDRAHAAARQRRPEPGADRQGHRPAPEEDRALAAAAPTWPRASTRSWPSSKPRSARWQRRSERQAATASPGSARAARTTPAPWCPKARARWAASAATSWRPGWTARPSASRRWAARACHGSASSPSPPTSTSSPTSATAPTSTAACWRSARASRPASTSPTRSSTTTRSR